MELTMEEKKEILDQLDKGAIFFEALEHIDSLLLYSGSNDPSLADQPFSLKTQIECNHAIRHINSLSQSHITDININFAFLAKFSISFTPVWSYIEERSTNIKHLAK